MLRILTSIITDKHLPNEAKDGPSVRNDDIGLSAGMRGETPPRSSSDLSKVRSITFLRAFSFVAFLMICERVGPSGAGGGSSAGGVSLLPSSSWDLCICAKVTD